MWEYNKLSKVQNDLLKKGIIDLAGDVNDDMAYYVREAIIRLLARNNPPDIEVKITSGGGDVVLGLDIYDMIRTYPGKKIGKVMSHAKSMAVVLLQACDERVAFRHSHILIHHISRKSVNLDQLRSKKKMHEIRKESERDQDRINEILSHRTGKSKEIIRKKCEKEVDMTTEEALKLGLIDKII
jgi:ATP-dependent Clp protease, protease subunit